MPLGSDGVSALPKADSDPINYCALWGEGVLFPGGWVLEGWFADCLINATICKDVHGYLGVAVSLWPCPLKCITRDREDCDGACLVFLGV